MSLPILYSFRRCPYAIRARLALLASGLIVELREISLADKPEAMLIASPKGTIPVMVLPNGAVLEESLDIMNFALSAHDPDGWLSGVSASNMAMVTRNDDAFKDHLDHYKYPDRYQTDRAVQRGLGLEILQALDDVLARQGKLTGPDYSLIDMAILPFVRQFAAVDEVWFSKQAIGYVQKWLTEFLDSSLFARAMIQVPLWQTGDLAFEFPHQLRF
jgi:glutathione S-transferase